MFILMDYPIHIDVAVCLLVKTETRELMWLTE